MRRKNNEMAKEIIRVENLKRDFVVGEETVHALRGVDFCIYEGEFVTIMGTSGSGKSTLLNIIGCLDTPTQGEYYLDGVSVRTMGKNDRATLRNRKIGFIFQSYNLLAKTTAVENVELPLMYNSSVSAKERRARAVKALQDVGLGDRLNHKSNQMSGGQQQRVALARALAVNPRVLLLDEPLSALDAKVRVQLRDEIRRIQLEAGTTTVFVTHDQEEALAVADRIGVMNHGRIEQIADPQTLYRRPETEYVATFIGLTNRLPGISNGAEAVVFGQRVPLLEGSRKEGAVVLVRPENMTIAMHEAGVAGSGSGAGEVGRVEMVHFLGALARVDVCIMAAAYRGLGGEDGAALRVTVQVPANELPSGLTVGSEVMVAPRPIAALAV